MSGFRIEHYSMGEVRVPADALWGAQTQRALQNLPVSGDRIDRGLIAALGHIKAAGAVVNAELEVLDSDMAAAIAAAARLGAQRVTAALAQVGELPLGGTAVGTGINAPHGFASSVIAMLADRLDLPLTEAANHFEAAGGRDALVAASGTLRVVAISLYKIANDLRWMASGPRAGLAEISLPELQPGSSIMPGKVNPVVCEAVCQVTAQVIGNDAAVAFGGAAGNFELNVMMPVIARNLLESTRLLAGVTPLFADRCVAGIRAHVQRLRQYAESSTSIVTALNRFIGYEAAAQVAKQSLETGRTIREVVIDRGHVERGELSLDQLDAALDVLAMTRP